MMLKANPRRIPKHLKDAARLDPDGGALLPTGAKVYYLGLAFFVSGYIPGGSDTAPYTKGVKM